MRDMDKHDCDEHTQRRQILKCQDAGVEKITISFVMLTLSSFVCPYRFDRYQCVKVEEAYSNRTL